jgi:MOSC domain-containing protein YiiM
MRIQSLNVAVPRLIEYKGEEVWTGIHKLPTDAALMVRKLNIDEIGRASCRERV